MTKPSITLKQNKSRPVLSGHPWIFSGAIDRVEGVSDQDDLVRVLDHDGSPLAFGLYSPNSQIRVRVLRCPEDFDGLFDAAFLAARLGEARARRTLLALPSKMTTGFRLINSEGDGLPGLIVDVFDNLVVMQLTTMPMVRRRQALVEALEMVFADVDGLAILEADAPISIARLEGFELQGGWRTPNAPEATLFKENGLVFELSTANFQKTGHFADMRIHRRWVAENAAGRRVLDAFSYTGGFGLLAAAHGAEAVVCVDSSAPALETLRHNAALNGLEQVEAVQSKVDNYLRSAFDRGLRFDIVVLDPPKLAPSVHDVKKALKLYESNCIEALRVLSPGGLLCVGSCSKAIGLPELERVFAICTARSARPLSVVYHGTQSPDHPYPAAMVEGRYITFIAAMA
ncbi:MAG: class I SAM-dependent rRNA methyltransferase [Bradymonadaceae bacterium]|nr:class I SAM-dependent rRNA methyltransferase [Lujinxingiaceae bacterium]